MDVPSRIALTAYFDSVSDKSQVVKMNGGWERRKDCKGTAQLHTNIAFTCWCYSLSFSRPVSWRHYHNGDIRKTLKVLSCVSCVFVTFHVSHRSLFIWNNKLITHFCGISVPRSIYNSHTCHASVHVNRTARIWPPTAVSRIRASEGVPSVEKRQSRSASLTKVYSCIVIKTFLALCWTRRPMFTTEFVTEPDENVPHISPLGNISHIITFCLGLSTKILYAFRFSSTFTTHPHRSLHQRFDNFNNICSRAPHHAFLPIFVLPSLPKFRMFLLPPPSPSIQTSVDFWRLNFMLWLSHFNFCTLF
jgi:hypothetical protein